MKKYIFIVSFLFISFSIYSKIESELYYFFVQLKDKSDNPFSVENPSEFLSQKSINRRAFFQIPIDSTDLPVNPNYIETIHNLGVEVFSVSKWLNGVTIRTNDSTVLSDIRALSFVENAQYTGIAVSNNGQVKKKAKNSDFNYGFAETQINNLNGKILHQKGYKGEGVLIAVIDAGFSGVNTNPAFQTIRNEGRIIGTKDFIDPNSNIYSEHTHGAYVLSTMAAEIDGSFVGTAPKASYLLLRTEDALNEYPYEPDFWVSAIEYADSIGADVATTSLGYTEFDDETLNYTYSMLDGNTVRASIAATMAYNKGILVFNSAGNEGNTSWKYISAPADAEGVITVGSVTTNNVPSSFSSFGPTYDSRIKPELCAVGTSSALVATNGSVIYGNGTSFSCPILAGMSACLLQSYKDKLAYFHLDDLRDNLYKSGSLYANPTNQMGYGIPNFETAWNVLTNTDVPTPIFTVKDEHFTQKIFIESNKTYSIPIHHTSYNSKSYVNIISSMGIVCGKYPIIDDSIIINPNTFATGIYFIIIN